MALRQKEKRSHVRRSVAQRVKDGLLFPSGADPWILKHKNTYYYCRTGGHDTRIFVSEAKTLSDLKKSVHKRVWFPGLVSRFKGESKQIWAPELHYLWGKWYIYFAADDGNNENHRMYVLESETSDPQGNYHLKGKICSPDDHWAIDGTVLEMDDGSLYFIWSGCKTDDITSQQNLYIAPMSNPWTISGSRVCISEPFYKWEKGERPYVNEGPEVLRHKGKLFIIYSASGSWTDDYNLGQLTFVGYDPLDPSAWVKKNKPVFRKTRRLFGPGHASYVRSSDNSEDWIIYHVAKFSHAGWNRQVRAKRFTWHRDDTPNFGQPA